MFVKKKSVKPTHLPPTPRPPPSYARSRIICTFADVEERLLSWRPANQAALFNAINTMSKGNMLLGYARGKVGDLVFSRQNGNQVVRARNNAPKNPRTALQMIQRIILYTVVRAYAHMKEITDHSFEGVSYGQDTMSAFMRENLKILRERVAAVSTLDEAYAFTPLGARYFAVNPYLVSQGSLPSIDTTPYGNNWLLASSDWEGDVTYQQLIDELGLQAGDQLTFIFTDGGDATRVLFRYARIILQPQDAEGNDLPLSSVFFSTAEGNTGLANGNSKNQLNGLTLSSNNRGRLTWQFSDREGAACIVVSRKDANGNWLRSTARLEVNGAMDKPDRGASMIDALAEIDGVDLNVINPLYLNNAGA